MLLAKRKNLDLTGGPLFFTMITYAIPLIVSNVFSALFHAVDMAVLARFAEGEAVAAVGSTTALTALFLNTSAGLGVGATVILARCFGEGNSARAQTVLSTSLLTGVFLGTALAVVGALTVPLGLRLMDCPAECLADATLYAVIYILGMPFYLVYSYAAAALRVSGDSEHPMYYMMAGGAANFALNILLCLILPKKVLAVAIATLASNLLGAFLTVRRLATVEGVAHLDIKKMRFDVATFGNMLKYGLPAVITQLLFPISNLQMQTGINAHGAAAIAGSTACSQYESIVNYACGAFASTAITFIGQNLGAKKPERVFRTFFYTQAMETAVALSIVLPVFFFGEQLIPIFSGDDPAAVTAGLMRIRYVLLCFPIAMNVFGSTIQAFGYPQLQTIINLAGVFGLRTVWMQFVYGKIIPATIENLYLCFPISLILTHAVNAAIAVFLLLRYRKGKYKEKV